MYIYIYISTNISIIYVCGQELHPHSNRTLAVLFWAFVFLNWHIKEKPIHEFHITVCHIFMFGSFKAHKAYRTLMQTYQTPNSCIWNELSICY